MSEKFLCKLQEECPVVMAACERKVKAESELRVKSAEYEAKRALMNELFRAAVKCRKMQDVYYKTLSRATLDDAKKAEKELDDVLVRIKNIGKPTQDVLPSIDETV